MSVEPVGAFAHKLPDRKPGLADLIEQATAAKSALRAVQGRGEAITDAEYSRFDEADFDATQAVMICLLTDHGIDRDLARKLGDLL